MAHTKAVSVVGAMLLFASHAFSIDRAKTLKDRTRTPLGDYIPCMFTPQQRAEFKGKLFEMDKKASSFLSKLATTGKARLAPEAYSEALDFTVTGKSAAQIDSGLKRIFDGTELLPQARAGIGKIMQPLDAPDDVSCSMSLMTWDEVHDIFGRRIADAYIAFHVNVRNLNDQNDFLLHDVQIAVDEPGMDQTGPAGVDDGNRFLSGRGKLFVRGIASVGQVRDRRNIGIRVAEAVGSVAASASIPAGTTFKDAANLFQGTAIPGLKNIFPDVTIDQMNRLNDLTFSTESTSRTLVPAKASVEFATFIPAALVDQQTLLNKGGAGQALLDRSGKKSVSLKYWPPLALAALQQNSYVVVAGVHVTEASTGQVAITKVDCELDLTKNASGKCAVTGENLQLVSKLVLKSATDSTDSSRAEAPVIVSGDPTSATAQFNLADLQKLTKGSYEVYWVDKSGTEEPTHTVLPVTPKPADSGASDKPPSKPNDQ